MTLAITYPRDNMLIPTELRGFKEVRLIEESKATDNIRRKPGKVMNFQHIINHTIHKVIYIIERISERIPKLNENN